MEPIVAYSLVLSAVLFTMGVLAVLVRRNPIIMFMGIELMLNAANLAFIAFSRHLDKLDGQVIALIFMAVAAAERGHRYRRDVDVDAVNSLRG